jgi:hypothetical protein
MSGREMKEMKKVEIHNLTAVRTLFFSEVFSEVMK